MIKNPKNPKKSPTKKTRVKSKKKATPIKNKISPPPQQPLNPWDKQPKESTKAYTAYCIYQNMGLKRSLQKTAEKFYSKNTSNLRQISTWSSKFNWVERVGTWEREQEHIKQDAYRKALEKMAKRHASAARKLQKKALKRLKIIEPEELNPKDTLTYITEAAKLERSALGAPDHKIEHSGKIETTDHGLERIIPQDPETREMIDGLLTRLATEQSRGVRIPGERREMDTSKTP
jgi:hypothetical protein